LFPVCCGAMEVPFDALYDIGMCTCTRLRSMTTTTITNTIKKYWLQSHKSNRRGSPIPALSGCGSGSSTYLEMNNRQSSKAERHRHLAHAHGFPFLVFFGTFPTPQKRGAGRGGGAQRARGNAINTAKRQNRFRTSLV